MIHRHGEISRDPSSCNANGVSSSAVLPEKPDLFHASISLPKWCQGLVTSVFRTRTVFAAFVRHAIQIPRDNSNVSSSPAFPIPIPYFGVFGRMPSGLSLQRRNRIHFRRAVVLVILALNFWWSGNRFISDDLLGRVPSFAQKALIRRVVDFMQVDGQMLPAPVVASGRRFPQLIARLSELSSALTRVGAQSSPYTHVFEGCPKEVGVENDVAEELIPYRSLQASRLKLVGSGSWDPLPFLDDNLAMAFTNPDCLLYGCDFSDVQIPRLDDPSDEILSLAKRWDDLDLLYLHPYNVPELFPEHCIKIFNCFKSPTQDRQIGDRRGRNWAEMAVAGPSKSLPMGCDIFELFLDPSSQCLSLSVTDRSDFYHQFRVTPTRAVSNTLNVGFPLEALKGTKALASFLCDFKKKPSDRLRVGDKLGASSRFPPLSRKTPDLLFPAFKSILQGDHGGVEYACQSHTGLLQHFGLLCRDNRLVANRPFRGSSLMEGLVIDDYFSISVSDKHSEKITPDVRCFNVAQDAYSRHHLLGSPSKDVVGQSVGRAIGAAIDAGPLAISKGVATLGVPCHKRYSLSWISLQICALNFTTDVLHACLIGGWVSCLTYRRPLMAVLSESFKLVDSSLIDSSKPKLVPLPRSVANELTLLSLLCPLAVSDLCAEPSPEVFATDASLTHGAICSCPIPKELSKILWRVSRSKGAYSRLLTPFESLSKRLGLLEEVDHAVPSRPERPLAFHYDFIEIFSGASRVTTFVAEFGFVVGPPVDLSCSEEFNMEFCHVVSWLSHMVSCGQVSSFMVEPPCTTFSIMRKPPLRSKLCPYGFDPSNRQTYNGNLLALRALQLMVIGLKNQVPGLLEKRLSSLLKHLPSYKSLMDSPFCNSCRSDSCMFGSIHQKAFRFISVHLDLSDLARRCDGSHSHVPIQGSFTKSSATYVDDLAFCLAGVLKKGIEKRKASLRDIDSLEVKGLESQFVNSLALSLPWRVHESWTFKKLCHINILEFSVLGRLAVHLASLGKSLRVTSLVDSFVVSAAASKGRTSSRGLSPVLRRFNAVCVAAGLYFNTPFVPTRLNISDDPTRGACLRSPSGSFDVTSWDSSRLFDLAELPKLRRWSSNWVRLILSLVGPSALSCSDRSLYRRCYPWLLSVPSLVSSPLIDFDATLGFPGEGPSSSADQPGSLFCLLSLGMFRPRVFGCVLVAMVFDSGSAVFPRNNADMARQQQRAVRPPLVAGRPVLPATTLNRDQLFSAFSTWCGNEGVFLDQLLENSLQYVEEINALLLRYGRCLYQSGRPYGHFSETINAVVSRKAVLRRNLQMAWDYAFAWVKAEPPVHHVACPWQVLLALVSLALMWGWTLEAGILSLAWGGLLRAGEAIKALRKDLLLPEDTRFTNKFVLLAISEPKTRFTGARHQSAKVDASDLVSVISLAFSKLEPQMKLWPYSGQTLRNRFRSLLKGLSIDGSVGQGLRGLDLGSLRPGGATWLLQSTEQSELVRRRGRWISSRVMEVYLQEVGTAHFMNALDYHQRDCIYGMASLFPAVLQKSKNLLVAKIDPTLWYRIYCWL